MTPVEPAFDDVAKALTIPDITGLTYVWDTGMGDFDLPHGEKVFSPGYTAKIYASPKVGYVLKPGAEDQWTFNFTDSSVSVDKATIMRGETLTITGKHFLPGDAVAATINSNPVDLGSKTINADGTVVFTYVIPQDFALGEHTVTLVSGGFDKAYQVTFNVKEKVTPAASPSTTTVPGKNAPQLAATGVDLSTLMGAFATAFIGAALLTISARRRR